MASQPVGVWFNQHLHQLDIWLLHIIFYRFSEIPPWEITYLTYDLQLISFVRGTASASPAASDALNYSPSTQTTQW
jgi:hypothetical protein